MDVSLAVGAAIVAHAGFAFSDSASIFANRKLGAFRVMFLSQVVKAVLIACLAVFFSEQFAHISMVSLLQNLGLGLVLFGAFVCFNKALSSSVATLNGVIAGAFPALVVPLSIMFYHERLDAQQAIFVIITLLGMLAGSLPEDLFVRHKRWRFNRELLWSLGAFLGWGVYFTFIRTPLETQGWFAANAIVTAEHLVLVLILGRLLKRRVSRHDATPRTWLISTIAVGVGLLALFAYYYAIQHGNQAIVTPIAGSYPALFALLAFWFYKDRLSRVQIAGLVLTLIGIIGLTF